MTTRRLRWIVPGLLLALATALTVAEPDPTSLSLVKVETARAVDFDQDVVWFLVLGSDARGDTKLLEGRTDAIQLVGVDFESGSAVAFGVPRDSWVEIDGHGRNRINAALSLGGPKLVSDTVQELFRVAPDYVVTVGLTGFRELVDKVGGVQVDSDRAFVEPDSGLEIRKGRNAIDGADAVEFARARYDLPRGDFDRSANHQELMRAIVRQLASHEDDVGFIEGGVRLALGALDTDLTPIELYRLAQAVTQIDLAQVRTCVLSGTPGTESGASIVYVDTAQARRLGDDARDDARLDSPCRG